MAKEQGFVARIVDHQYAEVVTERRDACSGCGASHCCTSLGANTRMMTRALNRAGAKKGDRVSISLQALEVTKSAAIAYLIPVISLMTGALMGAGMHQRLELNETASVMMFGFAGLGLGFLTTFFISRWMGSRNNLTPIITHVLNKSMESSESNPPLDPVCHMAIDPATAPATAVFQNKSYFFCHPDCRARFLKDPDRYI